VKIRNNRRYESTGEMKLIRSKELKYTEIRNSEQKEIASPKSAMRESFDRESSELKGERIRYSVKIHSPVSEFSSNAKIWMVFLLRG